MTVFDVINQRQFDEALVDAGPDDTIRVGQPDESPLHKASLRVTAGTDAIIEVLSGVSLRADDVGGLTVLVRDGARFDGGNKPHKRVVVRGGKAKAARGTVGGVNDGHLVISGGPSNGSGQVFVTGTGQAEVDSGSVSAYDNGRVTATGNAEVEARDSCTVNAYANAAVRGYGSASVHTHGSSTAELHDTAQAYGHENSTVTLVGEGTSADMSPGASLRAAARVPAGNYRGGAAEV